MINDKISNSSSQEILCTPPELRVLAENLAQDLLLWISEKYCEAAYKKIAEYKKTNTTITSENCLLVYFNEIAKEIKPGFSLLFSILEKIFTFEHF